QTLVKLMADPKTPAHARVTAASTLLKFGREGIELDDLATRIEALEQAGNPADLQITDDEASFCDGQAMEMGRRLMVRAWTVLKTEFGLLVGDDEVTLHRVALLMEE